MKWALSRGGQGLEEWHLALAKITIDINTRVSPALGVTTSEACFGFNPVHSRDPDEPQSHFNEAQVQELINDDDQDEVL